MHLKETSSYSSDYVKVGFRFFELKLTQERVHNRTHY